MRPWCQFVHVNLAVLGDEHLNSKQAYGIQSFDKLRSQLLCSGLKLFRHSCRNYRCMQDIIHMNVLSRRKGLYLPLRTTSCNDGYFTLERNEALQHKPYTGSTQFLIGIL
ncbi:hypothetical protein D1872_262290 [compost metagenome]